MGKNCSTRRIATSTLAPGFQLLSHVSNALFRVLLTEQTASLRRVNETGVERNEGTRRRRRGGTKSEQGDKREGGNGERGGTRRENFTSL